MNVKEFLDARSRNFEMSLALHLECPHEPNQ